MHGTWFIVPTTRKAEETFREEIGTIEKYNDIE